MCLRSYPINILYKSIAGRYRLVRVVDRPITARYRFIKNTSWVRYCLFSVCGLINKSMVCIVFLMFQNIRRNTSHLDSIKLSLLFSVWCFKRKNKKKYFSFRLNKTEAQRHAASCDNVVPQGQLASPTHYENTPIQIYWKLYNQKRENFQTKIMIFFHISAQNIDCGYSLEPPRRGGSNEYPQSMFWAEIRKIMYTPVNPSFTI